jgi:hypothetical protein
MMKKYKNKYMNGERMKTQKDDEMQKYTYKDDSSMQV